MDYGTFFFSSIVSVTVFAGCVTLLAWRHPSVIGMRWFAASLLVLLAKLILQALEGIIPTVLSGMLAVDFYLIASLLQLIGFYWFVVRKPFPYRWPFACAGLAIAVYTPLFLAHVRYSVNLVNIPNIVACAAATWLLLTHGRRVVSRLAAGFSGAQAALLAYRTVLSNLWDNSPWNSLNAHHDPRWLNSFAASAFVTTCMVMCYLWFLVTELSRVLQELARTDPLTGALNRRAIEEAALRETARSLRHGHSLCMIVIDVDHFKQLNDTRGHAAGDRALCALVRLVQTMLRKNDLLARTGGEEFTILLTDSSAAAAVIVAEHIRETIAGLEIPFEGKPIRFTVSIGVAQFDSSLGSWETMMRRADSAMYQAKRRGRNAVCHAPLPVAALPVQVA